MARDVPQIDERDLYDQIREAFAAKAAHDLLLEMQPLIDSLAEVAGDSDDTWRGIAMFATGIFSVAHDSRVDDDDDRDTVIKIVALCSAALAHPKVQEVTKDWPEVDPDD